jgi:hypothetical protein
MKQPPLTIQYLAPTSLKPNPRNPRLHSKKQHRQIAVSITQFGFVVPVLVDFQNQIIAGHGRILAAIELGMETVPTICAEHLSVAQAQAYMIADNKLAENAQWDDVLLTEHFIELSALDLEFDLDITGFEMGEIDVLIEGDGLIEEEHHEEPIASGPAVSKLGDVWQLGKHRIICGDSLQTDNYSALMSNKKAQMAFTDPPYNVPVNGHVSGLGKHQHREFAMATGEMSSEQFT